MTTMKNFAAQQLSKKQMNDVKGGAVSVACTVLEGDKMIEFHRAIHADTLEEALNGMAASLGDGQRATSCKVY